MHEVALDLLILLAGIWLVAVTLRPLGLPTVMGELIVGVLVGPAVLGLIAPGHAIELLAEIGIFFLMFHAGVETQPVQFFDALKRSLGIALAGAAVPFAISFGVAILFGLDLVGATFVGLTIGTATAVVVTLKCLKDLRLDNTRVARLILASCVINDLLTLVLFSLVLGLLSGGGFEPAVIALTAGKVTGFFAVSVLVGRFLYPRLSLPFRSEGGKGFTFVLLTAFAAGLFAEAIGLHMILGAYLAGLFFEEKVAHPNLVRVVKDRAYGIAYSFLGPIFFISLGFSVTFDISASWVGFMVLLTVAVIAGQILSAGAMALRMGIPAREAFTVGVGMCGRAEVAFILASLALAQGAIDQPVFSALIFSAFLMNLFTPLALKGCAVLLEGKAARDRDATRGVVQIDKFGSPLVAELSDGRLPSALPAEPDAVVIYGYGPEVDALMGELASRDQPTVVIEEDEEEARRLQARGQQVVYTSLAEEALDFEPLALARAVIANGQDELNALLAAGAREHGFSGPLVALVDNPNRRAAMQLAGATAAFTPTHLLAGALAVRASSRISPRLTGAQALEGLLEIAEVRVREGGPLANRTLSETGIHSRTGAHIVGRWAGDVLDSPPPSDRSLEPGTILIAAGNPASIRRLSEISRPIAAEGPIVVAGTGEVGKNLVGMLTDAGEEVRVIAETEGPEVTVVGDVLDTRVLERAGVTEARVVVLTAASDSAALLAARVIRDFAPEVPIIASALLVENAGRIQQAGADFALSVSQVSAQLLSRYVLDEVVSHQPRIRLTRKEVGKLAGQELSRTRVRERTGCSVVAVERGGEVVMEFSPSFRLAEGDAIYLCGTAAAFERYREAFPAN